MPTSEIQLLFDLGLIVMAAAAFAFIGKVIRVPSLVGYIIAGIFIGPILQWVQIIKNGSKLSCNRTDLEFQPFYHECHFIN